MVLNRKPAVRGERQEQGPVAFEAPDALRRFTVLVMMGTMMLGFDDGVCQRSGGSALKGLMRLCLCK